MKHSNGKHNEHHAYSNRLVDIVDDIAYLIAERSEGGFELGVDLSLKCTVTVQPHNKRPFGQTGQECWEQCQVLIVASILSSIDMAATDRNEMSAIAVVKALLP